MKILVIPDCQVKEGVPMEHLEWVGRYIVEKKPDVIVNIGDFADMPSLSSYDVGKKSFEGRRYYKDIAAANVGMELLMGPLTSYNTNQKTNKKKIYNPRLILTLGNHEQRIERAVEKDSKLEGLISYNHLPYESWGWEVYPFLEVVEVGGVCFSHYFTTGVMGRPVTSPNALLQKKHKSCVMGHVQQSGIATQYDALGKRLTGLFAGCCYLHDEDYLGKQGNNYFRGIWMLHDVKDGEFDLMPINLSFLARKYDAK